MSVDPTAADSVADLTLGALESPRSGWAGTPHGTREPSGATAAFVPPAVTVTVSREAGARGDAVAQRVARRFGWPYYDQEKLEYLAGERHRSDELFRALPAPAADWVVDRVAALRQGGAAEAAGELVRVVLALGARGQAVILGRGAHCVLPLPSTLAVRLVANLGDRIAYLAQLQRFTPEQAADAVAQRDRQRALFLEGTFRRTPADPSQYDLVLNSSRLGEVGCADLVTQAAIRKQDALAGATSPGGGGPPARQTAETLL